MRIRPCGTVTGFVLGVLLASVCASGAAVHAWEGTIAIPTYVLGPADPNPPFPLVNARDVYPYTMLDSLTNHRVLKSYRAIYLENEYLKLTILPALGGHLYSIYDKVDHREVLYRNHVIKYGLVGPRGAWISGGIEFSFPYAHTMLTVSPVESTLLQNRDGSATAVVGALDRVSGMHWEIALTLRPDTARVEQHVTLFNPTPTKHLYLFWANAAVKATADMQFAYPMRETISDDPYAVVQSWPMWQGVDESWYKNDPSAMAIFARQSHRDFFGVYYHKSDYGVVHVADFREDPGKKVWTWGVADSGLIWAHILSDHDGPYCEIQSGRFPTQGYREFMNPRQVETWREYWYPIRGLDGGFVQATRDMAINAVYMETAQGQPVVKLAISPVADVADARVIVKMGPKILREISHVHLTPLQPVFFNLPVQSLDRAKRGLEVQIQSAQGSVLLPWSAAEPVDGNPDFVPAAGTHLRRISYTPKTPLQEVYLHGALLEEMGKFEAARRVYGQVLRRDPGYIPALLKQALYQYRAADLPRAESLIYRALGRDGEDPAAHYLAGVIYRAAGRLTLAQDAFWADIHYGGSPAPAFAELGEIAIQQKNYTKAVSLLRRALSYNPDDALALAELALAERLGGHIQAATRASARAVRTMPLLPYALAEQWLDQRASGRVADYGSTETQAWNKVISADPQNHLAIAAWYHTLGAYASSDAVLYAAAASLPTAERSPMIYYYLASNARHEGKIQQARVYARKAASLACSEVFPNRLTDAKALAEAMLLDPADAHAQYALGNFLFVRGRYDEAASLWFKALGEGFDSPVLLRNLGVYAWRVKGNLPTAAGFYVRAIQGSPGDFRLYTDLDEIYAQSGDMTGRARLFRDAPPSVLDQDTVRARYTLFLLEESKFGRAVATLMHHQFRPWEGGVEVHNLFVVAEIESGKQELANHQPAQAEQAFRQAMEYPQNLGVGKPAKPDDAEQLYWLGVALGAEGRKASAEAAWQQAGQNRGSSRGAGEVFSALALGKLGQREAARKILERCIQSPARSGAGAYDYFAAGLAARYSHRAELARADFRHALQLDPAFWQARVALNDTK
jgi:tetratricopeptide (TPR) repeat protein